MVKLESRCTLQHANVTGKPWMYSARFGWNPNLIASLKVFPGVEWDKKGTRWLFPSDLFPLVREAVTRHEFKINELGDDEYEEISREGLYPYQEDSLTRIKEERGQILAYEMGLGKTFAAISWAQEQDARSILVVCPLKKKDEWKKDIYNLETRVSVSARTSTELDYECEVNYYVAHYDELHTLTHCDYDLIIFDEAHRIKNNRTIRGRAAKDLAVSNPEAYKLLLTGTPMDNQPQDIWALLDLIWPGRFGTWWKFTRRYCDVVNNGYAEEVCGLNKNPAIQSELKVRLTNLVHRVTMREAIDLGVKFPALNVSTVEIEKPKEFNYRELYEEFASSELAQHDIKIQQGCVMAAMFKLDKLVHDIVDLVEDEPRIVIAFYHKAPAKELVRRLEKEGIEPYYIDGETRKVGEVLEAIESSERSVSVVTMKSVGEGVNAFRNTTCAVIAEFYQKPAVVTQLLGRFRRAGMDHTCNVKLYTVPGTVEDVILDVLNTRIEDINKLIDAGANEETLNKALGIVDLEDKAFIERLNKVAASQVEIDNYL